MSFDSYISGFILIGATLALSIGIYYLYFQWILPKLTAKRKTDNWFTKNRSIKYIGILVMVIILIVLDFFRDYIFHNLSFKLEYVYQLNLGKSVEDYTDSSISPFLEGKGYWSLYWLKYIATAIFTLFYFIASAILLFIVYPHHSTLLFPSVLYFLGTLSMALVFAFGIFPFSPENKHVFYLITMEIGHFLQSSLPPLLLILSYKIYRFRPK